jgi:hypothetical protein
MEDMTRNAPLLGALLLAFAVGLFGGDPVAAQAPGQKAGEFFKNVTVAKDMPAELMQPSMQLMEIALGVHCVYCHDDDNTKRDLDTKPVPGR